MSETIEELFDKVKEFLKDKKPTIDAGWPEVSKGEMNNFYEIIDLMINLKWEIDCDGDRAVVPFLLDRTKYQLRYPVLLEHHIHEKSDSEIDKAVRHLAIDAQSILREIETVQSIRVRRHSEKEKKDKE